MSPREISRRSGLHRRRFCVVAFSALTTWLLASASAGDEVPMHEKVFVQVQDAQLYLQVRGSDRQAPLVLWLHGGPGGPERPLFRYYNGDLEQHFVVAYLDQRGTALSFDEDADPRLLTIQQHLEDLDRVITYLQEAFQRERLILVGHSWGGALGLLYSRVHPEKVAAIVAVAPLVHTAMSDDARYRFVIDEASSRNDGRAIDALGVLGEPPYPTATADLELEHLAHHYGGLFYHRPNRFLVLLGGTLKGLVMPWDIPRFIRGNNVSLNAMHDELQSLNLFRSVPSVQVPTYILLGRHDHHLDSAIAAEYFQVLEKPCGQIIWFEHSAHNVPFEQAQAFNETLTSLLLQNHQESGKPNGTSGREEEPSACPDRQVGKKSPQRAPTVRSEESVRGS